MIIVTGPAVIVVNMSKRHPVIWRVRWLNYLRPSIDCPTHMFCFGPLRIEVGWRRYE